MKLSRLALLVPAVAALGLAACSPAPTTAAQVGDAIISQASWDAVVEGCTELGVTAPDRASYLAPLVVNEAARQFAEREGIDVSGVREIMAADPQSAPYLANEGCTPVGEMGVLLNLLVAEHDQEVVLDALVGADITINPRIGEWDAATGAIAAGDGAGSISVPAGSQG